MAASAADYAFNPDNRGPLERFTHYGQCGQPGNGQYASIWLLVEDGVITQASYAAHGCMWALACGGVTATLVTGRPVEKALLLESKDIDLFLGGLPDGKGEQADRAITALRNALGG